MIPINKIIETVETLSPKIEQMIPETQKEQFKQLISQHKMDLDNINYSPFKEDVPHIEDKRFHWTPIIMTILTSVIGLNYLIIPLINTFHPIKFVALPDQLWTLIIITIPTHLGVKSIDKHLPAIIEKIGNKLKS